MAIRTLRRASINDDQKFWSLARAAAVTTTSGLLQIVPQSIAFTGTSASIVGNGQVAFSAVSSLSVNGVFTSDYRNYVVILRDVLTTSTAGFSMRLRAAGTDASAANYAYQHLEASSTVITGGRGTSQTAFSLAVYSTQRDGIAMQLYAPALAQSTVT